jgi:PTH1 family peptidyl-tRNA hydrolase
MKIIIGLGNPGKEYEKTRHNAGFLCTDWLRKEFGFAPFVSDKKMSAEISSGMIENEKVLIAKPQTFMNRSGAAVLALLKFYKLSPSDIVVIHDDLDIALGKFKTSSSSRSAGHNGVQNIIDTLGTQDFLRVRLGIGRPIDASNNLSESFASDFVLQNFSLEELVALTKVFSAVKEKLPLSLFKESK